ncbi:hypothetical protein Dsin_030378 [Dipteronia sinensis]|uniref:BED-type domain-containing protein n=1 Tax=Dipteronia sinensis TaxID=43782 RepID=A0AAE0DR90_9ROSI|nr:hypothetical protein Dsin_030378 [Dipteronia sinensis]
MPLQTSNIEEEEKRKKKKRKRLLERKEKEREKFRQLLFYAFFQKLSDMPNSLESMRAETEIDNDLNDNAPLWKYVTKLEKMGKGGENMSFKCNFCQQVYKGSYYRVKNHLLKMKGGGIASCPKVTVANLSEMQKVLEEAELRVKQSLPRQVPLPTTVGYFSASVSNYFQMDLSFVEKKKRKGSGSIEKAFNNSAREQLDSEIA